MDNQQYLLYSHGGMNDGFAPFLPYTATNGIHLRPTFFKRSEVLYFSTSRGVIHADCGVNFSIPSNTPGHLTMGAKYNPLGTHISGYCRFSEFGIAALEIIAAMVADVHRKMIAELLHKGGQ